MIGMAGKINKKYTEVMNCLRHNGIKGANVNLNGHTNQIFYLVHYFFVVVLATTLCLFNG